VTSLQELFQRNGYVRVPSPEKRKDLTTTKYKKGWEARLVLRSKREVDQARRLLARQGFAAGRPFEKARQWVLPVYGKRAVEFFAGDLWRGK
jgi:hypothetical protein